MGGRGANAHQRLGRHRRDVAVLVAERGLGDGLHGGFVLTRRHAAQERERSVQAHLILTAPAAHHLRCLPVGIAVRQQPFDAWQGWGQPGADGGKRVQGLAHLLLMRAVEPLRQGRHRIPGRGADLPQSEGRVDAQPRIGMVEQCRQRRHRGGALGRQGVGGVLHHHRPFVPTARKPAHIVSRHRAAIAVLRQQAFVPALAGARQQCVPQRFDGVPAAVDRFQARWLMQAVELVHGT